MQRAVFLDKDGTLVEDVPYNVDPQRITLAPRAREALAQLAANGFRLIVVSNQPGIALGYFAETALGAVEQRLRELLKDVPLAGFYYCPHHPDAGCGCRKPQAGLLERAAREQRLSLETSWMIGDILDDIEAGRGAGCRTVLIDNGNETEWRMSPRRRPDVVVRNLAQAASRVLEAQPA